MSDETTTIDGVAYKVTKLPPGYPEGSNQGMARWRASNADGSMRQVRHQPREVHVDPFGVGSTKHVEVIDLGGSLADDALGFEQPHHPHTYWKAEWGEPLPPSSERPAFHSATRGITQEPNGKPIRIGTDNDKRTKARLEALRAKREQRTEVAP